MEGLLDRGEIPPSPLVRRIGKGAVELHCHELLENRCNEMTTMVRGRDKRARGRQRTGFGGLMKAGTGSLINQQRHLEEQAAEQECEERLKKTTAKWDELKRKRQQRETDRIKR